MRVGHVDWPILIGQAGNRAVATCQVAVLSCQEIKDDGLVEVLVGALLNHPQFCLVFLLSTYQKSFLHQHSCQWGGKIRVFQKGIPGSCGQKDRLGVQFVKDGYTGPSPALPEVFREEQSTVQGS